jgi:hypothetical protein
MWFRNRIVYWLPANSSMSATEIEQRLEEEDLATLARGRGTAIQRALLAGSELEPSRVFLVTEGKVAEKDGKVRFERGLK